MLFRTTRRRGAPAALAAVLAAPSILRAQGVWPEKPVRIIVPFPPGQAADTVTRLFADELSRRWPQRVVVENRGGGAGAPGLEAGARAAPDGYTLVAGTSGTLSVNPSVLARVPYDAERDFAFITNVAIIPLLLVAHPSFPHRDARSLVAAAKAAPGTVDLATAGPATSQHMAAELFAHRTGTRFNMVHYRGSGPGMADLLVGQCEADDGQRDLGAAAHPGGQAGADRGHHARAGAAASRTCRRSPRRRRRATAPLAGPGCAGRRRCPPRSCAR